MTDGYDIAQGTLEQIGGAFQEAVQPGCRPPSWRWEGEGTLPAGHVANCAMLSLIEQI
ncbi:hypothetical protein ABBQ38_014375 [Trebouxia sp. C0009 RCD-2024]